MKQIYNYQKRKEHAEQQLNKSKISQRNKELLLEFLTEYGTDRTLSQARKNKYLSNFKTALELLNKDLDKTSVNDIRQFIIKVQERECSERTKEDYIVLMKVFYKWYKKAREPTPELKLTIEYISEYNFKVNRNKIIEPNILTPKEVKTLISIYKTARDKCLIAMLWDSGARIGEILTLSNKDITPFQHGYKIHIQVSKTNKRTLPLIEASPYIREYANQKGDSFRNENESFFIDQYGKALSYDGVRIMLKRGIDNAGISKRVYAHLFRHSRATFLANMGWSEQQLCKWFGWIMGSNMPRTYIKRSGIDIEEPMLELQGIETHKRKDLNSELKPLKCFFCNELNEATNNFCKKCDKPLRAEEIQKMEQERETTYQEMISKFKPMREKELTKDEDFMKRLAKQVLKEMKEEQ